MKKEKKEGFDDGRAEEKVKRPTGETEKHVRWGLEEEKSGKLYVKSERVSL